MLRQSRAIGVNGHAAGAANGTDTEISLQETTTTIGIVTGDLRGGPAARNTETGTVGEVAAATDRTADAEAFTLVKHSPPAHAGLSFRALTPLGTQTAWPKILTSVCEGAGYEYTS
jgi:hypothetical protein